MPTKTLAMNPLPPISDSRLASEKSHSSYALSSLIYNAAYYLSYGFIYPIAWVGHLVPMENPIAFGLRDGAKAAWDELHHRNLNH